MQTSVKRRSVHLNKLGLRHPSQACFINQTRIGSHANLHLAQFSFFIATFLLSVDIYAATPIYHSVSKYKSVSMHESIYCTQLHLLAINLIKLTCLVINPFTTLVKWLSIQNVGLNTRLSSGSDLSHQVIQVSSSDLVIIELPIIHVAEKLP